MTDPPLPLSRIERLPAWKWRQRTYVAALALAAVTCVWSFVSAVREAREAARSSSCKGRYGQLGLALHNYQAVHGCFPPAFIADENGRPMHSWRVLILPQLDHQSLYDRYRFDEPWDGPNNRQLHTVSLSFFNCPSVNPEGDSIYTNYLAVVGPNTMWPGTRTVSSGDITDRPGTTLSLVEVANSDVHWMEPRDLHIGIMPMTVNPPTGMGISSPHRGGARVGTADGGNRFIENSMAPATLRAWLTIAGGEPASAYAF